MKKLFLLFILISLFSCEKEEISIPCENKFIEMYNLQTGGVARYLIPYNCELSEQQNLSCYDCQQPNTGCRVVIRTN